MESAIMKMAKANHSNMKNLTPLIKPGTPQARHDHEGIGNRLRKLW